MTVRDIKEELRIRGFKRYSKLKRIDLIQYLYTGIHPMKPSQEIQKTLQGLINDPVDSYGDTTPLFSNEDVNSPINQIITGNCLQILPTFSDGFFDCCITDPPFNMSKKKGLGWAFSSHITMQEQWDIFSKDEYFQFSVNWIKEVLRVLKTNGNLFIFGSFHCIFTIGFILQNIFDRRIISQIVWYKPNAQPNITCRMFTESTEFIIWAVNNESTKAKNWTFNYETMKGMNKGKQMRNMWEIPLTPKSEKQFGKHPSQKPTSVLNRIILAGTNENDIIIDPFSGTGTTAVVAEQNNRKWIMIEKDETYNQIAQSRIDEYSLSLFEKDTDRLQKRVMMDRNEALRSLSNIERDVNNKRIFCSNWKDG